MQRANKCSSGLRRRAVPHEGGSMDGAAREARRINRLLAVAEAAGELGSVVDPETGERHYYATELGIARMAKNAAGECEPAAASPSTPHGAVQEERRAAHAAPRRRSRLLNTVAAAVATLALPALAATASASSWLHSTSRPEVTPDTDEGEAQAPAETSRAAEPMEEGSKREVRDRPVTVTPSHTPSSGDPMLDGAKKNATPSTHEVRREAKGRHRGKRAMNDVPEALERLIERLIDSEAYQDDVADTVQSYTGQGAVWGRASLDAPRAPVRGAAWGPADSEVRHTRSWASRFSQVR
ncbi:hypothetical protein ACFYP4_02505 [Streptomyces sp. NPDC005551]|uniref:hypothetical protein n=1 Tax=Streptomyces sp. NPDC005551 TaxID=3364725 RepID=UPI0036A0D51C